MLAGCRPAMARLDAATWITSDGSSTALYSRQSAPYNPRFFRAGGIAQLGERLHGMQEVRGSIPRTSTNKPKEVPGPHRLEA